MGLWDSVVTFLITIMPAIMGGIARYTNDVSKGKHKFNWMGLLAQLIIAGFVGYISYPIVFESSYFADKQNIGSVIVAISGLLSKDILDIIIKYFPRFLDRKAKQRLK